MLLTVKRLDLARKVRPKADVLNHVRHVHRRWIRTNLRSHAQMSCLISDHLEDRFSTVAFCNKVKSRPQGKQSGSGAIGSPKRSGEMSHHNGLAHVVPLVRNRLHYLVLCLQSAPKVINKALAIVVSCIAMSAETVQIR